MQLAGEEPKGTENDGKQACSHDNGEDTRQARLFT
jgi:hypothetical protein